MRQNDDDLTIEAIVRELWMNNEQDIDRCAGALSALVVSYETIRNKLVEWAIANIIRECGPRSQRHKVWAEHERGADKPKGHDDVAGLREYIAEKEKTLFETYLLAGTSKPLGEANKADLQTAIDLHRAQARGNMRDAYFLGFLAKNIGVKTVSEAYTVEQARNMMTKALKKIGEENA